MEVIVHDFDYSTATDARLTEFWETKVMPLLSQLPVMDYAISTRPEFIKYEFFNSYKYFTSSKCLAKFIFAIENYKCVGCLPYIFTYDDPKIELWNFLGSLTMSDYVPPCPPRVFAELLPHMPGNNDCFVNADYLKQTGLKLSEVEGGTFTLPDNFEDYINKAPTKIRQNFKKALRVNEDLIVSHSNKVDYDLISDILSDYTEYWKLTRDNSWIKQYEKVEHDLRIYQTYSEDLRAMYFTDPETGKVIGANFSINHPDTIVDAYCIRSTSEEVNKRGLGIYAVLQNIKQGIADGIKKYTLTPGDEKYKKQFYYNGAEGASLYVGTYVDYLIGGKNFYYATKDGFIWVDKDDVPYISIEKKELDHILSAKVTEALFLKEKIYSQVTVNCLSPSWWQAVNLTGQPIGELTLTGSNISVCHVDKKYPTALPKLLVASGLVHENKEKYFV